MEKIKYPSHKCKNIGTKYLKIRKKPISKGKDSPF